MSRDGWRIAKLAEEATMIPENETDQGDATPAGEPVAETTGPEAGEADGVEGDGVQAGEAEVFDGGDAVETADAADAEARATEIETEGTDAGTGETDTDETEADESAGQPVEALAAAEASPAGDEEAGPESRPDELRLLEALLFAASEPLDEKVLGKRLPSGTDIHGGLKRLQLEYAPRGVNLVRVGGKWAFRTANDLAWLLTREAAEPKKLSRAAVETLAIVAYHQPVTRAEIEEIRGVAVAKGTLDVLMETGWIRPRGRRKAPGRPVTYGTTDQFLSHFGLEALGDLPGLDELKGAGLFDGQLPGGFGVPAPSDDPTLREDEDPLDAVELDLGLAPRVEEPTAEEAAEEAARAAFEEPEVGAPPSDEPSAGEPSREEGD